MSENPKCIIVNEIRRIVIQNEQWADGTFLFQTLELIDILFS